MPLGGSGMCGMVIMGCMEQRQQIGLLIQAWMIDRQVADAVCSLLGVF